MHGAERDHECFYFSNERRNEYRTSDCRSDHAMLYPESPKYAGSWATLSRMRKDRVRRERPVNRLLGHPERVPVEEMQLGSERVFKTVGLNSVVEFNNKQWFLGVS